MHISNVQALLWVLTLCIQKGSKLTDYSTCTAPLHCSWQHACCCACGIKTHTPTYSGDGIECSISAAVQGTHLVQSHLALPHDVAYAYCCGS
jgi:hypothetical protein